MAHAEIARRITRRAARIGNSLTADTAEALAAYLVLLGKWNARINLTAFQLEPPTEEAIDRLIIEPLVAAKRILPSDALVIDVGSGGGSPAIPLKIAAPSLRMVLVESKIRKSAFLREAVRQLGLADIEVENRRLEELLSRIDLHEAADIVTVRAVRGDDKLWRSIYGLLRGTGRLFWFRSSATISQSPVVSPFMVGSREPLDTSGSNELLVLIRS